MRIKLSGVNVPIGDDKRGYVEYRFFTAIAPHVSRICAVDVVIRCDSAPGPAFVCTVVVDLASSGPIKTQARAVHPSAAIDRAADRTASLVRRRAAQDFSAGRSGEPPLEQARHPQKHREPDHVLECGFERSGGRRGIESQPLRHHRNNSSHRAGGDDRAHHRGSDDHAERQKPRPRSGNEG
jgi:ribosome-associated translation inhibitor RaiA